MHLHFTVSDLISVQECSNSPSDVAEIVRKRNHGPCRLYQERQSASAIYLLIWRKLGKQAITPRCHSDE
jgi:hypothetical protein